MTTDERTSRLLTALRSMVDFDPVVQGDNTYERAMWLNEKMFDMRRAAFEALNEYTNACPRCQAVREYGARPEGCRDPACP